MLIKGAPDVANSSLNMIFNSWIGCEDGFQRSLSHLVKKKYQCRCMTLKCLLSEIRTSSTFSRLTHWGLVTPYGNIDLGQRQFRKRWPSHQSLKLIYGIICIRFHSDLPGANELNVAYFFVQLVGQGWEVLTSWGLGLRTECCIWTIGQSEVSEIPCGLILDHMGVWYLEPYVPIVDHVGMYMWPYDIVVIMRRIPYQGLVLR